MRIAFPSLFGSAMIRDHATSRRFTFSETCLVFEKPLIILPPCGSIDDEISDSARASRLK